MSPRDGSSGAVSKPEGGPLPVLAGDPYSSCPIGIVRDPGLWLSPWGDSTAGGSTSRPRSCCSSSAATRDWPRVRTVLARYYVIGWRPSARVNEQCKYMYAMNFEKMLEMQSAMERRSTEVLSRRSARLGSDTNMM